MVCEKKATHMGTSVEPLFSLVRMRDEYAQGEPYQLANIGPLGCQSIMNNEVKRGTMRGIVATLQTTTT